MGFSCYFLKRTDAKSKVIVLLVIPSLTPGHWKVFEAAITLFWPGCLKYKAFRTLSCLPYGRTTLSYRTVMASWVDFWLGNRYSLFGLFSQFFSSGLISAAIKSLSLIVSLFNVVTSVIKWYSALLTFSSATHVTFLGASILQFFCIY